MDEYFAAQSRNIAPNNTYLSVIEKALEKEYIQVRTSSDKAKDSKCDQNSTLQAQAFMLTQKDLVEMMIEDAHFDTALHTFDALVNESKYPTSDLIDAFLACAFEPEVDFPVASAVVSLERVIKIHGPQPFEHLLRRRQFNTGDRNSNPASSNLEIWIMMHNSWILWKKGLNENNISKSVSGRLMMNFFLSLFRKFSEAAIKETNSTKGLMSVFQEKGLRSFAISLRSISNEEFNPILIIRDMLRYNDLGDLATTAAGWLYEIIMLFKISGVSSQDLNASRAISMLLELDSNSLYRIMNAFYSRYFAAYISIHYLEKTCSIYKVFTSPFDTTQFIPEKDLQEYTQLIQIVFLGLAYVLKGGDVSVLGFFNTLRELMLKTVSKGGLLEEPEIGRSIHRIDMKLGIILST